MDYQNTTDQQVSAKGENSSDESIDVDRLARLIADGQVPYPTDLPATTQKILAGKVSRIRRHRLLRFIARTIALDIYRSREP